MSKPRIFVSSTFVDLRDLREAIRTFVEEIGYEPIVFERGSVFYDHRRPLDENCRVSVRDCDVFILVIGGRYGSPDTGRRSRPLRKYTSITRSEYEAAQRAGIPIFVFVQSDVLTEYKTFRTNRGRTSISYAHVDNPLVFELIRLVVEGSNKRCVPVPYRDVSDIIVHLRNQFAGMLKAFIAESRRRKPKERLVRINGYKAYYLRRRMKWSLADLSRETGLDERVLREVEKVRVKHGDLTDQCFYECDRETVAKIELALKSPTSLEAGREDDFLSEYIQYYETYRGRAIPRTSVSSQFSMQFPTRAVVFDFDGTLTTPGDHKTTWEKIWVALGYPVTECATLHRRFRRGEFNHEEWCRLTLERFRERSLNEQQLRDIGRDIELVPGTKEVVEHLGSSGAKLYILSGSIKTVIKECLGDLYIRFEEIKANEILFDSRGVISNIIGTRYDFEGKAHYLKRVLQDNHLSPTSVLFVGNSCNDVWAAQSGVTTLCVNPQLTDPDEPKHWNYAITRMENLHEIMRYVRLK